MLVDQSSSLIPKRIDTMWVELLAEFTNVELDIQIFSPKLLLSSRGLMKSLAKISLRYKSRRLLKVISFSP